jgi:immunoglobulin-like protein involved in spore germination
MTMRTIILRLATLVLLALAAAPATASAALTAVDVRFGAQPAFVRVVVEFTGGRLEINEADATDPAVRDGGARVDVRHAGIVAPARDRSGQGVRARVGLAGADLARVRLTFARGRFKYVRLWALHGPERLVIDLYRSAPPSTTAAEIRTGVNRCLTLSSVVRTGRRFRVRGVERDLFEGSFVLRVRDATGRVVGRRLATARGAWDLRVGYGAIASAQAGTVEAVAESAKDGSLACLVQVRVALVP